MSIRQIRLGSRSCFIRFSVPLCLLMLLMCGSADSQVKAPSALEQLETRLSDIQIEVERLRRADMADAAKGLAAELKELRDLLTGDYSLDPGSEPESHVVMVHEAGVAPPGVLKGADRFRKGFVNVQCRSLGVRSCLSWAGTSRRTGESAKPTVLICIPSS
jgi:hypothetical protein